jgi:hypothetical protein
MVSIYESALRLHRRHAQNLISTILRGSFQPSNPGVFIPPYPITGRSDIYGTTEGLMRSKPGVVSRTLLPTIRSLRWSFKRDQVSRVVRGAGGIGALARRRPVDGESGTSDRSVAMWIEKQGPKLIPDSSSGLEVERTRLALCPGVGKIIRFYEGLSLDD